jgi:hypothetical protein
LTASTYATFADAHLSWFARGRTTHEFYNLAA